MIKLNEIEEWLNNCKSDEQLSVEIANDNGKKFLDIYRFDGEPIDDDILIARVDEDFNITTSDGESFTPFNNGDGYLENIENADIKDVVRAILGNIKTIIAENMSIDMAHIKFIDELCEENNITKIEVTTCNGQTY